VTAAADNALPLLTSAVMPEGFVHGFTTRAGGVSPAPYHSLNLGARWGDSRDNVLENRRRLREACGAHAMYFAAQVHGPSVVRVAAGDDPGAVAAREADALVTDVPGAAVAIFVADCVPVLFADPRTGACAAAHAGWRGVVAGVALSTVAELARGFGARAADLRVALGPCIGACCFEVGPEVVDAFSAALPAARDGEVVRRAPAARAHVDLRQALRLQLEAAGVPAAQIDASTACTRCDPGERFYSYRRDATRTGQHLGIIVRAP
jgi:YfiH family protein